MFLKEQLRSGFPRGTGSGDGDDGFLHLNSANLVL